MRSRGPGDHLCAGFSRGDRDTEHLANDTPETHNAVTEAGQRVLILAPETGMSPLAFEALVLLVDGVIGVPAQPPPAEAEAELETFLQDTCPPGEQHLQPREPLPRGSVAPRRASRYERSGTADAAGGEAGAVGGGGEVLAVRDQGAVAAVHRGAGAGGDRQGGGVDALVVERGGA